MNITGKDPNKAEKTRRRKLYLNSSSKLLKKKSRNALDIPKIL
jgi:hypothetical protein